MFALSMFCVCSFGLAACESTPELLSRQGKTARSHCEAFANACDKTVLAECKKIPTPTCASLTDYYACLEATACRTGAVLECVKNGRPVCLRSATDAGSDVPAIVPGGELRGEVEAILTADNAYSFGWGSEDTLISFREDASGVGVNACSIFCCPVGGPDGSPDGRGPERFIIPAKDTVKGNFLYFAAWSDESTSQGVLGQLRRTDGRAEPVYTGVGDWEVCATGQNIGPRDAPPTQANIEAAIAQCNAGTGDRIETSGGWVNAKGAVTEGAVGALAVGEDNSEARVGDQIFPITCQSDENGYGIDPDARWMWYDWDPGNPSVNPFDAGTAHKDNAWKDYLIFRLRLTDVVTVQ